ncbi:MAG: adenylosuccinate lyase [Anaerolineaceae bacterium]
MSQFEQYQSPFSWRYGSPEMRYLWSETQKRRLWRQIWVALATVESEFGLVTPEQVSELKAHADQIDLERALEIEAEIQHDLMAELKTFAEVCPTAGGIIHLGATSMDIEDNADALRLRAALEIILASLRKVLLAFADKIEENAALPVMAFTHLQPAEPSTLGYRFAIYAQDLFNDWRQLQNVHAAICGKGFKGAVGTAAAYGDLLGLEHFEVFEARLSQELNLPFYPVSTQTYPRKQDYIVISTLAGLGASLHKFAFDIRFLQSPPIGEVSEPFGRMQVGSSAMPFKRNPINAEKIDSLARQLSVYPQIAWQNAANSLLERTLDDSANRRTILPEAFLICDELLRVTLKIIQNLEIRSDAIERNLKTYAPFACTERVMMLVSKHGADRQAIHERLREHALAAWQDVQAGKPNPLVDYILADPEILKYASKAELERIADVSGYTGIAAERALKIATEIRHTFA